MIPRTACIVAVGTWGGSRCLVKVRDRNYEPKLKAYHEIRNGVEVLYVKDEGTGWVEGLNEFGIGVVSSALSVQRDENEKRLVKEVGKRGKDGVRILKVLEQKTLDDAVEQACTFKGGISGHTFVSDPDQTKSVESTKKHDCITKTVRMDHVHVRTNHGFSHEDAGYTDGDDYVSSVYRRDRAQKILRGLEGPKDLAPAIYAQKRDPGEMNSVIRDTDNMRTSSQLVIDLTKKTAYLYLIPAKVKWQGIVVDLPKGYKPKLSLEVFRYNRKGEPKSASMPRVARSQTLYRATTDPEARPGAHFTEKERDAFAYTNNPGFGGPKVFQYEAPVRKHLDAEDGLEDLADAYLANLDEDELDDLDRKIPRYGYDEDEDPPPLEARDVVEKWGDWGYYHVFHVLENTRDVEKVLARTYDWISYTDDFPPGSITWKNLGRATLKPSRELAASAARVAARYAKQIHMKGDRPKGSFYGDDEGDWRYTEGYPLGILREWDWQASIGLSSKNGWLNLSVDGATEDNRGFRKALQEIVREYPEIGGYWVSFDGPYVPVSKLVSVPTSTPGSRIDLGAKTYLHGTSDDVLDEILRSGLKPRGATNVEPTFGVEFGASPSREEAVYLTTQMGLASAAAHSAARKRKGTAVILEIQGLSHDLFQPDEDSGETDAAKSLERMGSVAYTGTIPPNKIKVHSIEDGTQWVRQAAARVASRFVRGLR